MTSTLITSHLSLPPCFLSNLATYYRQGVFDLVNGTVHQAYEPQYSSALKSSSNLFRNVKII